jgi:hypothetical protein
MLWVYYSSEVQFGQRVALIGISVKQCGQLLMAGSIAGATGTGFLR